MNPNPNQVSRENQLKSKPLSKEILRKIMDEIDDCGDFCVDYAYEVDDDDAFERCIVQCYRGISEEYNVPIEKIEEIVKSMINDEEGYDIF